MVEVDRAAIIQSSMRHASSFEKCVDALEARGILSSEMLAVCAACDDLNIDVIIESGRARGQSTLMLAKYFDGRPVRIFSIDFQRTADSEFAEKRLNGFRGLILLYGDSCTIVPKLVRRFSDSRIAVLIDGPKGKRAIHLAQVAFYLGKREMLGFIHDVGKGSLAREEISRVSQEVFFTDDHEYVSLFSYLDRLADMRAEIPHGWRPYRRSGVRSMSYGPTLAIFARGGTRRLSWPIAFTLMGIWHIRTLLRSIKRMTSEPSWS